MTPITERRPALFSAASLRQNATIYCTPEMTPSTTDTHIAAMPRSKKSIPITSQPSIRHITAVICAPTLSLPPISAFITMSFASATPRSAVIRNSLTVMMTAGSTESLPMSTSRNRAEITRNLSAIGSMMIPKVVICPFLRARYPSRKSVTEARANIAAPSTL